jgi:hypothetical protein
MGVQRCQQPGGHSDREILPPRSGQYRETGPRGGRGREVTVVKGEPLPPTTAPNRTYQLVDPTKNQSGRGK